MFFKTVSTTSGKFHSFPPSCFRVFHFLFKECGKRRKVTEIDAENRGIRLENWKRKGIPPENRGRKYRCAKRDFHAFHQFPENGVEKRKTPGQINFPSENERLLKNGGNTSPKARFEVFPWLFHHKKRVMPGFSPFSTISDGENFQRSGKTVFRALSGWKTGVSGWKTGVTGGFSSPAPCAELFHAVEKPIYSVPCNAATMCGGFSRRMPPLGKNCFMNCVNWGFTSEIATLYLYGYS